MESKRGPRSGDRLESQKGRDVRTSNIVAARAVSEVVRTSLGPKGQDKLITDANGNVTITNDGATVLGLLEVHHPAAKLICELSKSQDVEAGDGTTTVTVITGSMLGQAQDLLEKGIHPTIIAEAWLRASHKAEDILREVAIPVDLSDRDALVHAAVTSLSSKVVSDNSKNLAPLAVDAVLRVMGHAAAAAGGKEDEKKAPEEASAADKDKDGEEAGDAAAAKTAGGEERKGGAVVPNVSAVDLNNVRVVKKMGGTVEDTELVEGLVFDTHASHAAGGPSRVVDAKIGLAQFCISAPKTDMENSVVVSDYQQMDRILMQERRHILKMVKKIVKSGCNVLLIQKSILRDAVNDLALHYLAKKNIMVVRDVERADIEFISKTLGCVPVAHIDGFTKEKLGEAKLAEEVGTAGGKLVKITGVKNPGRTVTVLVRGSNRLVIDEAERSIHDALCVVRCLVKERYLLPGGGAPETELAIRLSDHADSLGGIHGYCMKRFAESLEVIPYTLAENAGLNPIRIVTELRKRHVDGEKHAGINVKKGKVTDSMEDNVLQPLLVTTSALKLATECTRAILKIDDIVAVR